ncbi:MAG: hypothetical protein Q7S16_04690 [bacterium]|nr:hypothetical protein [bacterium]
MIRTFLVLLLVISSSGCSIFRRITGEDEGGSESAIAAPADSPWPNGHATEMRSWDKGAGIAWAQGCVGNSNAATDANSYVKIWWLRLDGITTSGEYRQLAMDNYASGSMAGGLLSRANWGASIFDFMDYRFEDGALLLPVGNRSECLYHPWQVALGATVWRTPLSSDIVKIVAVAELQCFGDARAQIGADYWTSPNSSYGTQTEACASPWVDASAGRIVLAVDP